MKLSGSLFGGLFLLSLAACDSGNESLPRGDSADAMGHVAPSAHTAERHAQVQAFLDKMGAEDDADAERGLLAAADDLLIPRVDGGTVWNANAYDFIDGPAPLSVNPSLWRQAGLNNRRGLFEVVPGIYQIRGFDLANMTLISGDTGWIVVDPLTSEETAAAALAFAHEHLPRRPVTTVIFTHSHVDHFGGVFGVVTPEAVATGDVTVIAPLGFMAEATSEMVLVGQTMTRRADYMYGRRLARGARGHVGSGLGKQPAFGQVAIAAPSLIIRDALERHRIDGVDFIFQTVSGSEAPAEITFYLPASRAFCGAELVSRNLHNLYTLRGAKVRDALKWSGFIDDALHYFSATEVIFNSHHWPVWGAENATDFLEKQRDIYKYIHDQTLRLAGLGLTPTEIAEAIELPNELQQALHIHDYYGTVKHNAKAVYQFYFGWYDGNPASLDPLPVTDRATRYVEALGGAQALQQLAISAYDSGEYRWAAELLNHAVFADPANVSAKALLAKTYDQLGYQAESGPWRDEYLTGALELRHGAPEEPLPTGLVRGLLAATPIERFLELIAATVDGPAASGKDLVINIQLTDTDRHFVVVVHNGVMRHRESPPGEAANATLRITRPMLIAILTKQVSFRELLTTEALEFEGSLIDMLSLLALLDPPDTTFPIVTP
jgi:alkyl sulfatase BDS1-like metallo-beta-lactamase superfamily hydrolase